ncbi:hypothetical protein QOZ96_001091 [Brevundimonas nasdae]|uniref:hypothetical protein n=1 Tax=Brevundimonas nasdae TaxID=172043 RepID=UPI001911AC19|nr:hypothetical protein [Brevundimonas nasdae]MBK6024500.1 hypothetical protein [Brevundimonas nasdae]MDQ0451160.1 hypothetical protein [Brevundimonas nasdae]
MASHPTAFEWTGEVLAPTHPVLAKNRFVQGQRYLMAEVEHRSGKSHDHEFAWLAEAFKSLPEHVVEAFPTVEHLRKRALIDAGYFTETQIDAGTNAAALRVAAHLRTKSDFAVVVVRGPMVVERVAKSQSRRSMDKAEFQASKTAILEIVSDLLGVDPDVLVQQREAA